MNWYDLLRALHIIVVIAWMAGLMMLPRLYAYHTETAPAGSEFDVHFLKWEGKLLKIILRPSIILVWLLGITLLWYNATAVRGSWAFAHQPWMLVKLLMVLGISGWQGFLTASYRKFQAGERPKSAKFWRATNELPFLAAIVAVLAVTLEFGR